VLCCLQRSAGPRRTGHHERVRVAFEPSATAHGQRPDAGEAELVAVLAEVEAFERAGLAMTDRV
jgi:hypothetical protein